MRRQKFRRFVLRNISIVALVLSVGAALSPATARGGYIYVVNYGSNTIGEYTTSGGVVNAALISGLHQPSGIAVSGSNLYVTNEHASSITGEPPGIGKYTTSGAVVNTSLVTDLNWPFAIAASEPYLFVTRLYNPAHSAVAKYTTSGTLVNDSLLYGFATGGIAVSGSNLFVTKYNGTIGEYTTSGATVNASLVSGLFGGFAEGGIAVYGSYLFVTDPTAGTIGKYTTDGATVNASLVSGLSSPYYIAMSGSNLFVTNQGNGTIGEYDATTGATVNASLISGLNSPLGIAVTGDVPEPSSLALLFSFLAVGALGLLAYASRRRRRLS